MPCSLLLLGFEVGALAFVVIAVVVVVVVEESFPFPFRGSLVRDPVVGPRGVARVVDVNSC